MTSPAYAGADLGLRRDLTSIVTVTREAARRPEATDHLVVRSVMTWNPKQSETKEVDFTEVRAQLDRLPARFPGLRSVLVDAAAESSSVLPFCRQHPRLALIVQPFTATADTNMQIWSALAARLNARTISIPRHERLLSELRGLRLEAFSFGSKWRVVDNSRRFHRDVSFSLALAVFAAGAARTCMSPLCDDPDCDGVGPLTLLFSEASRAWSARHPTAEIQAARAAAAIAVDAADVAASDDEGETVADRVRALAAAGFSKIVQMGAERDARREESIRARERRIDLHLRDQRDAARERAAQEAVRASERRIMRSIERVGWWWPGE